ncbi:MAG: thiol peroxidase [Spirochaetales bacterium]|nr:thiol peroxidase [Spirochaetales bacterium]
MAHITLKGAPTRTVGDLPAVGSKAPDFRLTKGDLSDVTLADFRGITLVISIVPSVDTGVCAASAHAFNQRVKELGSVKVLTVSRDLPFAQRRFCEAEGIDAVVTLSELRNRAFGQAYGAEIVDGPMAGLLSRAVVVVDPAGRVSWTQQVPEIGQEPDYDGALNAAKAAASY